MHKILNELRMDKRVSLVRIVDESFIFLMSNKSDDIVMMLQNHECIGNFTVCSYKQKVYVIPRGIDKNYALHAIKRETGAQLLVSAGDSEIDIPMLNSADFALVPSEYLASSLQSTRVYIRDKGTDFASWIFITAQKILERACYESFH
jgi:hydroxymethylpyrimidine pyrophosphatase-like HAD family hydrolase